MPGKQTQTLSKRFVFAVLVLAFVLVIVSSLLTFIASCKLSDTLADLSDNQQLTTELSALPLRMESLLNAARSYARSNTPEDLAALKVSLASWRLWETERPPSGDYPQINEIEQLTNTVNGQLNAMVVIGEGGQHRRAAKLWQQIETEMPGQRLQALTTKLAAIVRNDFNRHAAHGREIATVHERTGFGLVVIAIVLGIVAAVLLGRRMRELESFITVCAWTKRVKYKGRWVPFEEFLEERFQLQLSHGISEEAATQELEKLPTHPRDN